MRVKASGTNKYITLFRHNKIFPFVNARLCVHVQHELLAGTIVRNGVVSGIHNFPVKIAGWFMKVNSSTLLSRKL
jgi:hypothetical protein